ncbi:DegT/DnrJ/EryC1/StrS family aminotransferase [Planctomycetota bacterium]
MSDTVPLVDLAHQHSEVADEIDRGFRKTLASCAFVMGEEVRLFEQEFAERSGVRHCIGVGSGTDALELALRALDVGPGDEVVVPVNTFAATALAAVRAGATPVLVDCDPACYVIEPDQLEATISERTKAIIPVHLYGQMAPMQEVLAIADQHGIAVLEDAAQVQGATQNGVPAGSAGHAGATSFYPSKNLGAYGDAGAVLTSSDETAARVRGLRNYGSEQKNHHPVFGVNSRLDTLQAVVLRAKLKRLAAWNEQRRQAAQCYDEMLSDLDDVVRPATMPGNDHVFHLYVIQVPERDRTLESLREAGVHAGVHYPAPLHLLGAFQHLAHGKGSFPVAERLAGSILSLPLFPGITVEQQQRTVDALRKALR